MGGLRGRDVLDCPQDLLTLVSISERHSTGRSWGVTDWLNGPMINNLGLP